MYDIKIIDDDIEIEKMRGIVIGGRLAGRGIIAGLITSVRDEMNEEYGEVDLDMDAYTNLFGEKIYNKLANMWDKNLEDMQHRVLYGNCHDSQFIEPIGLLGNTTLTTHQRNFQDAITKLNEDICNIPYPQYKITTNDFFHRNVGHPFSAMYGGNKKPFR